MKRLKWQIRMAIFTWMVRVATKILPNSAPKTLRWLLEMPWEGEES